MKIYPTILIPGFLAISIHVMAQPSVENFKEIFRLEADKTSEEIIIDGKPDESTWEDAAKGSSFWQKVPYFAPGADPKTEVMLSYNDNFLYVAAKCYQSQDVIIQSLRRDEYWDNDGIAIILDPQNTRTNAYLFGITAAGAQWDAINAQTSDINSDWSNKWYSAVDVQDSLWSMEMAIPLRILKYSKGVKEWGMNFVRNHLNESEYHNWTAVPESFWPPDPAFAGALVFDEAPEPKKGSFNIIPYVSGSIGQDLDGNNSELNAGLDARVSVSPTLNLDITFNPDFSQIEVDELVTNLTRFSILLPEKRTFFLESNDLFDDFGIGNIRPFVSRKIGLDQDRQAIPILYGLRMTGSLMPNTRIGAMNIHSLSGNGFDAQNQSMFSVQQKFGRSFIQGMFINRQAFDGTSVIGSDYGRNTGLEAVYVTDDGQWQAFAGMHHGFKENVSDKNGFYILGLVFTNPNWEFNQIFDSVDENYYADLGFVNRIENYDATRDTIVRVGYRESLTELIYRFRPRKSKYIARHNIRSFYQQFLNSDWTTNEGNFELSYEVVFRSRHEIRMEYAYNNLDLLYPFTFVENAEPLPAQRYTFNSVGLRYTSDDRKTVSGNISGRTGGFYNGTLDQMEANINFRAQPWGNFGLGYQWNQLDFPDQYGQETVTAFLSKIEIGFNTKVLWTTLFQYIDQSKFMGINSRLQWRFAPMSDLFLVYIDNYDVDNGLTNPNSIRANNRGLILKVNYWY